MGSVSAYSAQSTFTIPKASNGDALLEPYREDYINHFFVGINRKNVRVYVNFPSGQPRMNLRGNRPVPAAAPSSNEENTGYIDGGEESPYDEPNVSTEIFTIFQLTPEYRAFNPTNTNIPEVMLNIPVMRYGYQLVTDDRLISQFMQGTRRVRFYTIGSVDAIAPLPQWLHQDKKVLGIAEKSLKMVE